MAGLRAPDTQDALPAAQAQSLSQAEAQMIVREVRALREDVKDMASKFESKLENFREDHTGHGDRLVKLEQIAERLDEVLGEQRSEVKELRSQNKAQEDRIQKIELWKEGASVKLSIGSALVSALVAAALKFIH